MTNRTLAPVLLQALVLGRATLLTHGMELDSAVDRRTARHSGLLERLQFLFVTLLE